MKIALVALARSGTSWLCKMMEATGVAGMWGEYWWVDTPYDWCLNEMLTAERAHGVVGIKVFQEVLIRNIQIMLDYDWKFVRLQRDDKLAQAFSSFRAFKAKNWHEVPPEAAFDKDEIWNRYRYLIMSELVLDATLDRFLRPEEIYHLRYEDLYADPELEVRALAKWLGIDLGDAQIDPQITPIYRDEQINEQWRARFEKAELKQFQQMWNLWKMKPGSLDLDYRTRLGAVHGAEDGLHVDHQGAV